MIKRYATVSRDFVAAIKLADRPAYRIAHQAGIHPSVLSRLMNGIDRVAVNDPRVLKVARVLGLRPDECFSVEEAEVPR